MRFTLRKISAEEFKRQVVHVFNRNGLEEPNAYVFGFDEQGLAFVDVSDQSLYRLEQKDINGIDYLEDLA